MQHCTSRITNNSHSGRRWWLFAPRLRLGEAKLLIGPSGSRFLYGYARHSCNKQLWHHLPLRHQREYIRNPYKNFICRERAGGCAPDEEAILLHYARKDRPEPHTPIAKNFLLFTARHCNRPTLLAITLVAPHRVHTVNPDTGRMALLSTSQSGSSLGFLDPVGLSAGPVRIVLPDGRAQLLVAAHTRRGGWEDHRSGMRMSFFYTCDMEPPFHIRTASPVVSFGFSESLEYMTHMELRDAGSVPAAAGELHISLGADDCASVLVRVPLRAIIDLLTPVNFTDIGDGHATERACEHGGAGYKVEI